MFSYDFASPASSGRSCFRHRCPVLYSRRLTAEGSGDLSGVRHIIACRSAWYPPRSVISESFYHYEVWNHENPAWFAAVTFWYLFMACVFLDEAESHNWMPCVQIGLMLVLQILSPESRGDYLPMNHSKLFPTRPAFVIYARFPGQPFLQEILSESAIDCEWREFWILNVFITSNQTK